MKKKKKPRDRIIKNVYDINSGNQKFRILTMLRWKQQSTSNQINLIIVPAVDRKKVQMMYKHEILHSYFLEHFKRFDPKFLKCWLKGPSMVDSILRNEFLKIIAWMVTDNVKIPQYKEVPHEIFFKIALQMRHSVEKLWGRGY